MQCLEASELISLRLDQRLSADQEQVLRAHLVDCQTCQKEWQMMQRVTALFDKASLAAPPPLMGDRIMARIRQRDRRLAGWRSGVPLVSGSDRRFGVRFNTMHGHLFLGVSVLSMALFRPNCRRNNDARGVYHNDDIRGIDDLFARSIGQPYVADRSVLSHPGWRAAVGVDTGSDAALPYHCGATGAAMRSRAWNAARRPV